MNDEWTEQDTAECKKIVTSWVSMRPVESNPSGLDMIWQDISKRFISLGFDLKIDENSDAPYRPLLTATREISENAPWIGFFGHYDVEEADSLNWNTDPWELHEQNNRWYGRGVGDNLVPLAQRLILFKKFSKEVNLVYYLQGEEEIGSPFANQIYPGYVPPPVALWIEETGYFYTSGQQRLMLLNSNSMTERIISDLKDILNEENRTMKIRNRPLNKAFGADKCPCLAHLVNNTPYLAIGPNDDSCKVHGSNESISIQHLGIVALQYHKIAEVVANE
jgi:hypothetical protein